jgi:hypothetical protein
MFPKWQVNRETGHIKGVYVPGVARESRYRSHKKDYATEVSRELRLWSHKMVYAPDKEAIAARKTVFNANCCRFVVVW